MPESCSLPFEPGMGESWRSDDPVTSAGSGLGRDGIRKHRSRLWQAHAKPVRPVREALGQEACVRARCCCRTAFQRQGRDAKDTKKSHYSAQPRT